MRCDTMRDRSARHTCGTTPSTARATATDTAVAVVLRERTQAEALLIEKANVRRENATLTREMQMLN